MACTESCGPGDYTTEEYEEGFPLHKELKEIDENTWLLGQKYIVHRSSSPEGALWIGGNTDYYAVTEAGKPPPPSHSLPDFQYRHICHNTKNNDEFVEWDFDKVLFSIRKIDFPGRTREHVTLNWLNQQSLSFWVPEALLWWESGDKYYLLTTTPPFANARLNFQWAYGMTDSEREDCASQLADMIRELTKFKSKMISGVDKGLLIDRFLSTEKRPEACCFTHEALLETTRDIFKDKWVDHGRYYFANLNMESNWMRVYRTDDNKFHPVFEDWTQAGFVPYEWIATKYKVARGLAVPIPFGCSYDVIKYQTEVKKYEMARMLNEQLVKRGFYGKPMMWMKWGGLAKYYLTHGYLPLDGY